jgi:hypothetical protein
MMDMIKISDMIVPIKINTPMKEKEIRKNISLGSDTISTNSIDEFIVMIMIYLNANSDILYVNIEKNRNTVVSNLLWHRFFNFY